jgi:hypothetical protein
MSRFALFFFAGLAGVMLAGCAGMGGNEIQTVENEKQNPDAVKVKYLATVRIAGYTDGRNSGNPRKLGIAEAKVMGLSGTDILLDRDATELVTDSMRRRLEDSGLQILAKNDASAMFELSGVVKELKYDVKARDYVSIKLETTLKEIASGKVVWAGEVAQKNDRYAGSMGNSKSDIADYLQQQLGVVTGKTTEAINSVLMATHPELFNLTPGTKVIPGVTVFVAPNGAGSVAPDTSMLKPMFEPSAKQQTPGTVQTQGTLTVRTEPARAKVYLDGVYYGMSPLNIESAVGIRTVEVKLKGYKSASEKVAVRAGALTEMEFQLEK